MLIGSYQLDESAGVAIMIIIAIIAPLIGLYFIIKFAFLHALRQFERERAVQTPTRAFPVIPAVPVNPPGPGTFKVGGVVKETGSDVSTYIAADSAHAARVK